MLRARTTRSRGHVYPRAGDQTNQLPRTYVPGKSLIHETNASLVRHRPPTSDFVSAVGPARVCTVNPAAHRQLCTQLLDAQAQDQPERRGAYVFDTIARGVRQAATSGRHPNLRVR